MVILSHLQTLNQSPNEEFLDLFLVDYETGFSYFSLILEPFLKILWFQVFVNPIRQNISLWKADSPYLRISDNIDKKKRNYFFFM